MGSDSGSLWRGTGTLEGSGLMSATMPLELGMVSRWVSGCWTSGWWIWSASICATRLLVGAAGEAGGKVGKVWMTSANRVVMVELVVGCSMYVVASFRIAYRH